MAALLGRGGAAFDIAKHTAGGHSAFDVPCQGPKRFGPTTVQRKAALKSAGLEQQSAKYCIL